MAICDYPGQSRATGMLHVGHPQTDGGLLTRWQRMLPGFLMRSGTTYVLVCVLTMMAVCWGGATRALAQENTNPIAVDDTAILDEDTDVVIPVLANDTDADGDTLVVESVTQANFGEVGITDEGTVTYKPFADYSGEDTFFYIINDGNGGSTGAMVTVTINGVNDNPVASDDTADTNQASAADVDVLANDTDVEGDLLERGVRDPGSVWHGHHRFAEHGDVYAGPRISGRQRLLYLYGERWQRWIGNRQCYGDDCADGPPDYR